MKAFVHLLSVAVLCVACLLGGCGDNPRATALLSRADSLMASRPDSALQLLDSCEAEATVWPESQQMRHRLLQAKARNKAYVPFTSDSVMTVVADYYDRNGTANEQMEAHYLLGCVYRDLGEAPKALAAYHDAVECADTTAADCDYKTLCRVYAQMSDVYYTQQLFADQLVNLDHATYYGYKANDTLAALLAYSQKINAYQLLLEPDSMLYVCETVSSLFQQSGFIDKSAGVLCIPVRHLLDCGDIAKACRFLNIYERRSGFFDDNHNIKSGREIYYYTKGYYYLKTCQYDSAEYFFRKELATGKDFNNQNAGAHGLSLLFQQTHKPDSAAKYALYSYEMNDSVYAHKATEEVAKTKALYDYTRYEHEAQQEKERADRERSKTIAVLVLASIVVSIIVILFWLLRKRHRAAYRRAIKKLGEAQNTILHLREHEAILNSVIERQTEEHKATEELKSEMTILRASIKEREAEIEKQKTILDRFQQKEILTKENVDQKINQSDIYKHLRIIANQGQRLTDEDWSRLMQLVISQLPGFYHLISSKERDLTRLEYQICILDRLGIEPSRMRYLLGISESYVSRMRGGLHKKIFDSPASGKEFSLAIRTVC
jgi:tetratricopeptide (TPR) repeat protein